MMNETIESVISKISDWEGKEVKSQPWSDYVPWNSNHVVSVNGKRYFVKIPGLKSELFFDRDRVYEASKLAEETGVGPKVAYYLPESGVQIDEWLEDYEGLKSDRWIFQHRFEEKFLFKSLDVLKRFHNSGGELQNQKTVFDTLHDLTGIMNEYETFQPREMSFLLNLIDRIEEAVAANGGMELKPCINNHNERWSWDFLWNSETQDLKIVDYEFASMNDVCSDLATLSTSAMLYDDQDEELVEYYFGELDQFQFARFKLFKLLVTLKGCFVFAILDKFRPGVFDWIREYSWRMAKFRALVRDPRTENWIWMVKNHQVYDQWKGYPLENPASPVLE